MVVVSSTAASCRASIQFDDLAVRVAAATPPAPAYGQSKLANLLFTSELGRRLEAAGSGVVVAAAHPGWTQTNLQQHSRLAQFFNPLLAMEPPGGALPTLRAATDPAVGNDDYFGPDGWLEMRGTPKRAYRSRASQNATDAERLWKISEERTGVQFDFGGRA